MHDLQHAVVFAQSVLTDVTHVREKFHPDAQALLSAFSKNLWDQDETNEPHWETRGCAEVGFDIEMSMWGAVPLNLLGLENHLQNCRMLMANPLILVGTPWPFQANIQGKRVVSPIRGAPYPLEGYCTPIPLDWIAKFFTKKFWQTEFLVMGHEALKLNANNFRKTVMNPMQISFDEIKKIVGNRDYNYVKFTLDVLHDNGHIILSEYLRCKLAQLAIPHSYLFRWSWEIRNWREPLISQLEPSVVKLNKTITAGAAIGHVRWGNHQLQVAEYNKYVQRQQARAAQGTARFQTVNFQGWYRHAGNEWNGFWRDGGHVMRDMMPVWRLMLQDIAQMQRMIVDFYSMVPDARARIYTGMGEADQGPMGAIYLRMGYFRKVASDYLRLGDYMSHSTSYGIPQDKWAEWGARFRACYQGYSELLGTLGEDPTFNPEDPSWKARFSGVPSSYWKNRCDRLAVLANKEYARLDSRIRPYIDRCEEILRNKDLHFVDSSAALVPQADVDWILSVVRDSRALGNQPPQDTTGLGIFHWEVPETATDPTNPPPPPLPADISNPPDIGDPMNPALPPPNTPFGIVFGESSFNFQLSAAPPIRQEPKRRTPLPGPPSERGLGRGKGVSGSGMGSGVGRGRERGRGRGRGGGVSRNTPQSSRVLRSHKRAGVQHPQTIRTESQAPAATLAGPEAHAQAQAQEQQRPRPQQPPAPTRQAQEHQARQSWWRQGHLRQQGRRPAAGGFSRYANNADVGSAFIQTVDRSGALGELLNIGIPSTTIQSAMDEQQRRQAEAEGSIAPAASGDPGVGTAGAAGAAAAAAGAAAADINTVPSIFRPQEPGELRLPTMYPHAFADPTTTDQSLEYEAQMNAEAAQHAANGALMYMGGVYNPQPDPYRAPGTYREASVSSDEDVNVNVNVNVAGFGRGIR